MIRNVKGELYDLALCWNNVNEIRASLPAGNLRQAWDQLVRGDSLSSQDSEAIGDSLARTCEQLPCFATYYAYRIPYFRNSGGFRIRTTI